MEPIVRVTARVVPVNEDGAALLLLDQDPAAPGVLRWASIGGGVEAGESAAEAAVRELYEETGIVADTDDIIGPLCRVKRSYTYDHVRYDGDHTYLALAVSGDIVVNFDRLEPEEVGNVLDAAWFSPEALVADGRMVEPDLPDIIASAISAVEGTR
ncbi:hypothetical protein BH09ACT12_BH09ACT12_22750 [soil metagenome]